MQDFRRYPVCQHWLHRDFDLFTLNRNDDIVMMRLEFRVDKDFAFISYYNFRVEDDMGLWWTYPDVWA